MREYIDEDFSYALLRRAQDGDSAALKALQWITKYNNEAYRGVVKKNDPDAIHKTPTLYKAANDAHNARRRDLVSNLKSGKLQGGLASFDEFEGLLDRAMNSRRDLNHEDVLIELCVKL